MMKVLHIVGNKIEASNGIGRLLPEMIKMQNKYSSVMDCSMYCINDDYDTTEFRVIDRYENDDVIIDEYDLFIFHGVYFYSYNSFAKKIIKHKKKYLVKPHSSLVVSAQKKSFLKKFLANAFLFKKFIKSASAVIFTNEDEGKNSVQWNARAIYEGNGISSIQYVKSEVRKKSQPYKFVYLSRIDFNHKGTDILLDALEILKGNGKIDGLNLSIYGKGSVKEEKELIRRIDELNISNVTFNGPIFGQLKNEMLSEKDIFILTSRYEGFPMAILEALDSGLPCLVTRGVNMSTIIEKYNVGWECDATPEDVAKQIVAVMNINEELLAKMSLQACEYIIKEHDWPSLVKYSESIYTKAYKRIM